jgi:two-component system LytT family response regulator
MISPVKKLRVSTLEGLFFFNLEEIIRLEASSNYTQIYFTNRRPMLLARVLKDFTGLLEPLGFENPPVPLGEPVTYFIY